jgi:hypothetical protein
MWQSAVCGSVYPSDTRRESADCQVVLHCLAEAQGFDVAEEALAKSAADAKRGVRNGQ